MYIYYLQSCSIYIYIYIYYIYYLCKYICINMSNLTHTHTHILYIYIYIYIYIYTAYTALQIRDGQRSITANLLPLTAHIYHVMIIVTGGFSKKSVLFYYYFLESFLNDLEPFSTLQQRVNTLDESALFLLVLLQSLCILTLSTICTFRITSGTKEKTKSFNLTSNTFCCEI